MDVVDLLEIWKIRGNSMKSVPNLLQGVCRLAMRQSLDALIIGDARVDSLMQTRAWKLFFLIPQMFLFHPALESGPKKVLMFRVDLFHSGQWSELAELCGQFHRCSQRSGETPKGSPEEHCGEEGSQSVPRGPIV